VVAVANMGSHGTVCGCDAGIVLRDFMLSVTFTNNAVSNIYSYLRSYSNKKSTPRSSV
jgi:hypothetical protein